MIMPAPHLSTTRAWKLKKAPLGAVTDDAFELTVEDIPSLKAEEILVQTLYLSNDPSQRAYIQKDADPERLYAPPIREGSVMAAYGIARVLASNSKRWTIGDLVVASTGWREHAVLLADRVKPLIALPGHSPTLALGTLGMPALTAWYGLYDVCGAKPEHTILISGAAGSTGSAAVQIAKKILGAKRVIGIAGGASKCSWVERIGADVCLDYRAANFQTRLKEVTEGFVDVYLDLVGGDLLNKILSRMKRFGKIAAVGSISTYNDASRSNIPNWAEVISNRLTITGYIVTDFVEKWPETIGKLAQAVRDGTIVVEGGETVCEVEFQKVPEIWKGLFTGINQGKLITKLVS